MAIVVAGDRERVYLPAADEMEKIRSKRKTNMEAGCAESWNVGKQRTGASLRV